MGYRLRLVAMDFRLWPHVPREKSELTSMGPDVHNSSENLEGHRRVLDRGGDAFRKSPSVEGDTEEQEELLKLFHEQRCCSERLAPKSISWHVQAKPGGQVAEARF